MLKGIELLHNLQFNTRFFHSTSPNLKKRISNEERAKFQLDPFLKQVLVGNILGDVYLRKVSPKSNVRLVFRQGSVNSSYLFHLYNLFQEFVTTPPSVSAPGEGGVDTKTGKSRFNLSFTTLALPCFNEIYETFYLDG
jgi:hypothetical protein